MPWAESALLLEARQTYRCSCTDNTGAAAPIVAVHHDDMQEQPVQRLPCYSLAPHGDSLAELALFVRRRAI